MAIEYIIDTTWGYESKIQVCICDKCGWRVEDLENRIDLEWYSEHDCGCEE